MCVKTTTQINCLSVGSRLQALFAVLGFKHFWNDNFTQDYQLLSTPLPGGVCFDRGVLGIRNRIQEELSCFILQEEQTCGKAGKEQF